MRSWKQFVGGILVGLAFGMFIGVALAENKRANPGPMAGVGIMLAIVGGATARSGSAKVT